MIVRKTNAQKNIMIGIKMILNIETKSEMHYLMRDVIRESKKSSHTHKTHSLKTIKEF